MIRKLQALKAKKGFTLVELMVVIAIIGVLAAILIPLMANFIISARINSHNSTASSARNQMTAFLAEAQSVDAGYASRIPAIITMTVEDGRIFDVDVSDVTWEGNVDRVIARLVPDDPDITRPTDWKDLMDWYMNENMPDAAVDSQFYLVIANNAAHVSLYSASELPDLDDYVTGDTINTLAIIGLEGNRNENNIVVGFSPQNRLDEASS